jgi:hypothetical protein
MVLMFSVLNNKVLTYSRSTDLLLVVTKHGW